MLGDRRSPAALRRGPFLLAVALALSPAPLSAQPFEPLPTAKLNEPADPPIPVVAVRVRVPLEVVPDKELTYRISVVNLSRAAAHHVTLRNPLPANVRFVRAAPEAVEKPEPKATARVLTWQLGTLGPGARKEVELVVLPTGGGEVLNCARVQFEHGQCVRTRIARPGLRLRAAAPAEAILYDEVAFKIDVTNTGKAPARNVKVTDTLPEGWSFNDSKPAARGTSPLTWELGDLAPGQTRRIEYRAISKKTGTYRTRAMAEADGGLREEGSAEVRVGEAVVALAVTGPKHRLVGRTATYVIRATNSGTLPATNVQVTNELPIDVQLVRASAGGTWSGKEVRWALGRLEPGASRTLQLDVRARRAGLFKNVVHLSAERGLTDQARAETKFEKGTGLALEISRGNSKLEVGGEMTVVVRALNAGRAREAEVGVTVIVPEGLEVVRFKGPVAGRRAARKVEFEPLPALGPGVEVVYTVQLRAVRAGEAALRAEAISERVQPERAVKVEEMIVVAGSPGPRAPKGPD